MTYDELERTFLAGAGLEADDEDSVTLGHLTPILAPGGIDAVMAQHTAEIDALLERLPSGSVQRLELQTVRGFTYNEFLALFELVEIKERDYSRYPIFQSLFITSEQERRRWLIYTLSKEYDSYLQLLVKSLAPFNQSLLTFFFRSRPNGEDFRKKEFGATRPHCR